MRKIVIDLDCHTIRVGDFVYSIDVLESGLQTTPEKLCKISASEPAADGTRVVLVQLWDAP